MEESPLATREALEAAFRLQIAGSQLFESDLYEALCKRALEDIQRGGPIHRLLGDWEGDPLRGFLPLRLLGGVHERVLAGAAPELARFYPSMGGTPLWPEIWDAFLAVVESEPEILRERLAHFPQTNEVRRCAGLLGGFLSAAQATGLPLRIRELGCSAGLNLHWDRYRYELGPHRWGSPHSPVRLEAEWSGGSPPLGALARVESRAGCDIAPRRVQDPQQARLLEAYVWPDQIDRIAPLRAAVQLARESPVRIDQRAAGKWLAEELEADAEGTCTVVYHSSFWIYVPSEEQQTLRELIERRGERATPSTPLAWLRHEDGEVPGSIEVRLRLWPGGEERHLAMSHPHGRRVKWLASS